MSTRTVGVTVLEFFIGGVADVADGDVEVEGLAGEGVVGVDGDAVGVHLDDGDDAGLAVGFGAELHAGLGLGDAGALEGGAGDFLDELLLAGAVTFLGGNGDLEVVAGGFAFEVTFEAGDDVGIAVEVGEGLAAFGGIYDLTFVALERVVDGDNLVFADLHGRVLSVKVKGDSLRARVGIANGRFAG